MKILGFLLRHSQLIIIGVVIAVIFLFVVNPTVMLQGLSTGMGIILAQKLWMTIEKYRGKTLQQIKEEINGVENIL